MLYVFSTNQVKLVVWHAHQQRQLKRDRGSILAIIIKCQDLFFSSTNLLAGFHLFDDN